MRIENRTPWKTEHLRAIARRVLRCVHGYIVRRDPKQRVNPGIGAKVWEPCR